MNVYLKEAPFLNVLPQTFVAPIQLDAPRNEPNKSERKDKLIRYYEEKVSVS
jgi:hypothetical protein